MHIIIPARYASKRLPGKPLLDIAGRPLIQRVYECAQRCAASSITIATDDPRIEKAARGFGAKVCLTSGEHRSGTDRIAEVIARLELKAEEIVVNLQGDEPLMPPALIEQVAQCLESHPEAAMATACHAISDVETLLNPNVVKVVWDHNGYALYFSRAPIPWPRDKMLHGDHQAPIGAYRHIGVYAYRAGFVSRYAAWPACALEQTEQLEQLRVLWRGERIAVCEAGELPGPGVDTAEDLETVRRYFAGGMP